MKMTLSCSSEDTEFIDLVKKEFNSSGTVAEYKVTGITGYETTMLVIGLANIIVPTIASFISAHMTSNKDSVVKSKRCIITNKNGTMCLEGYDEKTIKDIVEIIYQEQN